MISRIIILSCICFLTLHNSHAQKGFEAGGWLGATYYFGDLNPDYDLRHPGFGGGGIIRYNFNERLNLRFGANYLYLYGNDNFFSNSFQQTRGLNFKNNVFDLTGELEFNFFSFNPLSREDFFTPFLSAGLGIFKFNPKATYNGVTRELQYLGTEGQNLGEEYFTTKVAGVVSGGVKYALTSRWIIQLIVSTRILSTDYIDDVSTTYPDPLVIESLRDDPDAPLFSDPTETSYPGKQRGDSVDKDNFNFIGIGLTYFFGGLQCPDISK